VITAIWLMKPLNHHLLGKALTFLSSEDNIEQSGKDASPTDQNLADGMSADLDEDDDEWW